MLTNENKVNTATDIKKGSRWIGCGGYYQGEIEVLRFTGTWVKFNLTGHGLEEIKVGEFLKYFRLMAH